jgi:sigma-E factor negative regulatory protein RseA
MTEKISRFLDNDLSHNEMLDLLQEATKQPELKDKLRRYAAVSHAIKNDNFSWVADDFVENVQQGVRQSPAIVVVSPPSKRRYYWLTLAAASTAAIAIFAGSSINWSIKQADNPVTLQPLQQASFIKPPTTRITYQRASHPSNARINDYLQEHDNSGYSNGESFVRLANYSKQ